MTDDIVSERARGIVMALGVVSLVATVVAMVYGRKLSPRAISPQDSSQEVYGNTVQLSDVVRVRAQQGRVSVIVLPKWQLDAFGVASPRDASATLAFANATGIDLEVNHVGGRTDRPKARPLHTEGLAGSTVDLKDGSSVIATKALMVLTRGAMASTMGRKVRSKNRIVFSAWSARYTI